jgi:dipeptidyl aminopeptidase/acylaminoacyl peptidase
VPGQLRLLYVASIVLALAPLAAQQQRSAPFVLSQLTWFDRTGKQLGKLGPLADHGNLELSPDGSLVAVAVIDRAKRTRDIWMYQTATGMRQQFTSDAADENWLIFSPDGARVVLNAFSPAQSGLFSSTATAAVPRMLLLDAPSGAWPVSWSPDGSSILVVTNSPKTANDIWSISLTGDSTPKAFQRTEASENWAAFSPDGRWVAFSSTAGSDDPEVYVTRFPTAGQAWRISADGGTQARWRGDGKEILYISPDRQLMSAAITLGDNRVTVDRIEPLFTMRFPYGAYHAFDVTKDGQRILVNTAIGSTGAPQQADLPSPRLRRTGKVRLYEEGRQ